MAFGFGKDKLMGDDAVIMATASGITTRWNIGTSGSVYNSLETENIGFENEEIVVSLFIRVIFEFLSGGI